MELGSTEGVWPSMSCRRIGLGILAIAILAMTSCGDSSPTGPVATTSVSVQDNTFGPQNIVVSPGATVTWTWVGQNEHIVVWNDSDLEVSEVQASGTHSVEMPTTPGDYGYHCYIHGTTASGMHGSVRVQ